MIGAHKLQLMMSVETSLQSAAHEHAEVTSKTTVKAPNSKYEAPRGRPVSGRPWKTTQKTRFSAQTYKATKTLSTSWEAKMAKRAKEKALKETQLEIKERHQAEKDEKKRAREEREKRRAENELKSASVQVVCIRSYKLC